MSKCHYFLNFCKENANLCLALLAQGHILLSEMKPCLRVPVKANKEGKRRGEDDLSMQLTVEQNTDPCTIY